MLLFKNAVLKPVMEELQEKGGNMLLVKDEGIYLMAEKGAFRQGRRLHIAYAEGFDPRLTENEDWYEKAYLEVGGDDFGEVLGSDFWGTFLEEVINKGCDVFIDVSETQLRAGYIEHS
ncbi:DUF3085 domain-containing protein [Sodalis sp. RH14]|uniref:DUF3085 domain-containing protein n=1 Tax=Sodalis sp. RH14 TaxID=3394329 RepID=UPI001654C20F